MAEVEGYEWDYFPVPDGEPFTDKHGHEVLGWHPRFEGQDPVALLAAFEAYYQGFYPGESISLTLRPILTRSASEVECKINGWEEGTFVRCTTRAKHTDPKWQIEADCQPKGEGDGCGGSGRIPTGECREAMSGPTCRNPACPPCNTPETEPCPGCTDCKP